MIKKYPLYLTFLICLVACTNKQVTEQITYKAISEDLLASIEPKTSGDSLYSLPSDSGTLVYVQDNYLYLLHNQKKDSSLFIEVRDKNNNSLLYRYSTHDETLLVPLVTRNGACFTIHDVLTHKIISLDLDGAVHHDNYKPTVNSTNISSERILQFEDKLVFLNPDSYEEGSERILFSNSNWSYKEKKVPFNSANVIHGELICRPDNTKLAFIPDNFNEIEIFTNDGSLEKKIGFPHQIKQKVNFAEINGKKTYYYVSPLVECFSSACSGKDNMIFSYIDDNHIPYIIMMDWEGNIGARIASHGKVKALSLSDNEDIIYSWERADDKETLWAYVVN